MTSIFHNIKYCTILTPILFWAVCLFFISEYSQDKVEYKHIINDSIEGLIKAEIQPQKDSMFVGDFEFITTYKNENPFKTKTSLYYKGMYDKDLKTGPWKFNYKTLKALENFSENEYLLNLKTSGKEFYVSAQFDKGFANGKWHTEENPY